MAVPKYDELMNPVLQALHELGGSATISELEEQVATNLKLSEKDVNEIHRGNMTKLYYRLTWTRNYLKRYGLVERSARGIWSLTSKGRKIKTVNKEEVKKRVQALDKEPRTKDELELELPEIKTEFTWKEELLQIIKNISPSSFENLCKRLLRESGFTNVEVTGKTGDGGIDGKGVVKIGGLLSFHVVFQAKRYKETVPVSVVRDFRGAMDGRADKGLIITTGTFTREARTEAQRDGASPIDLIDGESLVEKLKELAIGITVNTKTIEDVIINKEWFENV